MKKKSFLWIFVCCLCLFGGLCFTACSCDDNNQDSTSHIVRFLDFDESQIGVVIDGEIVYEQIVEHGHSAVAPQDPTREGYRFDHWEGTYTNVTANTDIFAVYVKQYTVTFVDYDDTVLKVQVVDEGSDATAPELEQKEGYVFCYWDHIYTNITQNLTVMAIYNVKTFSVKFLDYDNVPLGALIDNHVVYEQNVEVGHSAVEPEHPTRDGYRFTSWSRDFGDITADMIIYAQYVQTCEVVFLDYDYSIYDVQVVDYGKSATPPAVDPTRTGYRFDHWEGNYTNVLADTELTAVYVKQYTVTFVDYDDTVLKIQAVDEGSDAMPPANPTLEGYTFEGWSGDYTNIMGDTKIKATYQELVYTVSFYDYYGKLMKTERVYHGTDATAPELDDDIIIDWDSIDKGYRFVGWDKTFENVNQDLNVYAVYEAITTPIIYIEPVRVESGSTQYISVSVYVISSTPFSALEINLSYNGSLNLTRGDVYVKNMFNVQDKYNLTLDDVDNQLSFSWISTNDVTLTNNYTEVFELRFQVDKHLPVGEYEIELQESSSYVKDYTKMTPVIISGAITIYKEEANNG